MPQCYIANRGLDCGHAQNMECGCYLAMRGYDCNCKPSPNCIMRGA